MSREFGDYGTSGFFHDKISCAAEDAASGEEEITKLWGKVLERLYPVAYAISSVEAGDSSIDRSILSSINHMDDIKNGLVDIEKYLESYKRVMVEAVREAAGKK